MAQFHDDNGLQRKCHNKHGPSVRNVLTDHLLRLGLLELYIIHLGSLS